MYKILLLFLSLTLSVSAVKGQSSTDSIVSELLLQYDKENWGGVLSLFEKFAKEDPYNAEVFYWLRASENEELRPKVLLMLADSFYRRENASKTILMYKELVTKTSPSVPVLLKAAEIVINLGDVKVSQLIHQKILDVDPKNLKANLFLGNFIFLRGEKERKRLEYNYNQKKKHSRMEYAEFRTKQRDLYTNYYAKAKGYLTVALSQKNSEEVKNTLQLIDDLNLKLK